MNLFFDERDLAHAERLNDSRFDWLADCGAIPLQTADKSAAGFLFGYQNGLDDLDQLVADRPHVRDRVEDRREVLYLDETLRLIDSADLNVPRPRTWVMRVDDPPPPDLEFPLFVRTSTTSWKRGGAAAKVRNLKQLDDEVGLLRRAFGWDETIVAREWLDLAKAGEWRYGDVPVEVRVWIVDHAPAAWSFHYLNAVADPKGLPPSADDLAKLHAWATSLGPLFRSRLIAADFARTARGDWVLLELGPGACCGTAHEGVFKGVAHSIASQPFDAVATPVGATF